MPAARLRASCPAAGPPQPRAACPWADGAAKGAAPGARGCEEQGLCRWPLSGGSWLSEIKSEPERSKGLESQQELQIGIES